MQLDSEVLLVWLKVAATKWVRRYQWKLMSPHLPVLSHVCWYGQLQVLHLLEYDLQRNSDWTEPSQYIKSSGNVRQDLTFRW